MFPTVDDTIDLLIARARKYGAAMVSEWPVCAKVEIAYGEPVWYLEGISASEQQVRTAWAAAAAASRASARASARAINCAAERVMTTSSDVRSKG